MSRESQALPTWFNHRGCPRLPPLTMIGVAFHPPKRPAVPSIDQGRHVRSRPTPRDPERTRASRSPGRAGVTAESAGVWRPTGRAVLDIVPGAPSRIDTRSEQCLGGQPRATTFRCFSSGHEAGRRRSIGAVAVFQLSTARPRRWGDAGEPPNRRRTRRPVPIEPWT